jgi:hypothetical protein
MSYNEDVEMTPSQDDFGWPDGDDDDDYSDSRFPSTLPTLGAKQPSKSHGLTRGFSFKIIENSDIQAQQRYLITRVQDTLAVSKNIARAMLLKMQWNDEKL